MLTSGIDADPKAHLVAEPLTPRGARTNTVWWNTGSGTFTNSFQNPAANDSTALGDFDGDGDVDLASAIRNGANTVWANGGTGTQRSEPRLLVEIVEWNLCDNSTAREKPLDKRLFTV